MKARLSIVDAARFLFILLVVTICSGMALAQEAAQNPFPAPTGPYSVGRTEFDWVDTSRPDPDNPDGHREIAVWVWYPASLKHGAEPAEWMPGKWGELFWSKVTGKFPAMAGKENLISSIRSHSFTDAPLSSKRKTYPVLLFEPGFGGVPLSYASLTEDSASHGYIVVGVVPTHYSGFTVLSGGRVPSKEWGPFSEGAGDMSQLLHIWSGDMTFALDQLEKSNAQQSDSPFAGRIDFAHVGAFGQSFGGFAALEALKEDSRVRAAIDLDGRLWKLRGGVADIHKPLLIFRSHNAGDIPWEIETVEYEDAMKNGKPGYQLTLDGSLHDSFSDMYVLARALGLPSDAAQPGVIDPLRAIVITNAYVTAFFGHYLMDEKTPLLEGPSSQYPEVQFKTSPPAGAPRTAQSTAPVDVTGTWTWTPDSNTPEVIFKLKEEGDKITGRVIGGLGDHPPDAEPGGAVQEQGLPIAEGKIEGEQVTIKVTFQFRDGKTHTITYKGKINGNQMTGTFNSLMGDKDIPFSATKQ